jgi:hypothetical protein
LAIVRLFCYRAGRGGPNAIFLAKISRFSTEIHGKRNFAKSAHFAFVDTVPVPRIAQTRATDRSFRLEIRNTVLFRSSRSDVSFSSYHAVTDKVSREFAFDVTLLLAPLQMFACARLISLRTTLHSSEHCTPVDLAHVRHVAQKFCSDIIVRIE